MNTKKPKKPKKFNVSDNACTPEPFITASAEREACKVCNRHTQSDKPFGLPWKPKGWTGRLAVVMESDNPLPTARRLIQKLYKKAGYHDKDIALIHSVRCHTEKAPGMTAIRACRPFFLKTLKTWKPAGLLGVGSIALRTLTNSGDGNITKNRGIDLEVPGL